MSNFLLDGSPEALRPVQASCLPEKFRNWITSKQTVANASCCVADGQMLRTGDAGDQMPFMARMAPSCSSSIA